MNQGLTRIHVEGFRSLRSVDLAPGPLTVLVGPNGSGKSNLLSVLRMVPLVRTQSLRRFVGEAGGASTLLHYGPKVTPQISLRLDFSQETGENAYVVRLGHAAHDALIFLEETVEFRRPGQAHAQSVELGAGHAESMLADTARDPSHTTARSVSWLLGRMSFFHFHDTSASAPLRQNARREDTRYLRSDGSNLAAYLYMLANAQEEGHRAAWTRISSLVRQVAPFVKRLEPSLVMPEHPDTSAVRLDWVDERDQLFGPHHLSDGTLRAIALITALAQPSERLPRFVSVDEPELGLHPAALSLLVSLMRSISGRCQVLVATQSPALLDLVEPEEVVVVDRQQGETTLSRLDPASLAAWLEDYTLSQLYDKNLLGGRP